jgi:glucose-6-phosphate isomerase
MTTYYSQDLEGALASTQIEAHIPLLTKLHEHLKQRINTLPVFNNVHETADLKELSKIANHYRTSFEDIIILGTGGSSLGGQSLLQLRTTTTPRVHFMDNIDPDTFTKLFEKINPKKTGVIAISKSGNTSETLMQLLVCLIHWENHDLTHLLSHHFLIISEPTHNGIREIAQKHSIPCLDHHPQIGGRYAVFSLVGMLPALIAGLNAQAIRSGAIHTLENLLQETDLRKSDILIGILANYLMIQQGLTQSVVMPYIDRLMTFAFWYRQLWAESLGKNGNGSTPVQALGTVDQHSQLQLYLDGPQDKFFTIITMNHTDSFKIDCSSYTHPSLSIFHKKTMGNLLVAEQKATIDTLRKHQKPTRVLHLKTLDEATLGALMMFYILETLGTAYLLNVDPLDQPAVEESKILTRHYLAT